MRWGPSSTALQAGLWFQMSCSHRFESPRGELDSRAVLLTLNFDPTIIVYAAHHQFTRWDGKASGDLPIVKAQTPHNGSLGHVGEFS
jgi:hypothetical protein